MIKLPNDDNRFIDVIKSQFPNDDEYRQQLEFRLTKSLVPIQSNALSILDWIFYGARGSGRTYVLCVVALLRAIRFPNTWIDVYDHFGLDRREYRYSVASTLDIIIRSMPSPKEFTLKHNPRLQIRFSVNEDVK